MTFTKMVAIALTAGMLTAGAADAQIKRVQPAEFPPASYKGKQYVDSKGCVFIRAGIDGNTSWVPRVTRSRKIVCGFTPTNAGQVAEAAPQPAPANARVTQITVDETPAPAPAATQTAAAAPAPAPTPRVTPQVRRAQPAARVVRQTAPQRVDPIVRKPVAKVRVQPAPAPAPAPVQQVVRQTAPQPAQVATACPGASAISQQYLRGGTKRSPVRCGPQAAPIVGGTYRTAGVATGAQQVRVRRGLFSGFTFPGLRKKAPAAPTALTDGVTDHRRIVPKHVAIDRINTTNVRVPHGYRPVWDDGRLNPKRAEQTLSGRGHMLLVWTNTVPRRLIDRRTGKDVTASVPLVYPYLDEAHQSQDLGEVSIVRRDGQLVKRIVRHNHRTKPVKRQAQRTTYSTRSAPKPQVAAPQARAQVKAKPQQTVTRKAKPAAAVGGKRFVQIGLFSTRDKAMQAVRNLSNMGMQAQMANVRYKGQTYLSLKAGPFSSANATQNAVNRLRGVGYTGAKARN